MPPPTPELPEEPESGSTSPASREDYIRLWNQLYAAMDSDMSLEDFRKLLDSPEFQVQINGVPRLHNLMRFRPGGGNDCTLLHVAFSKIHKRQSSILKQMFNKWGQRRLLTEYKIAEILKPERGGQLAWTMQCGPKRETPLHSAVDQGLQDSFMKWLVTKGGASNALFIKDKNGLIPSRVAYWQEMGSTVSILEEAEAKARGSPAPVPTPNEELETEIRPVTRVRSVFDPIPYQPLKNQEGGRKRTHRKKRKGKTKKQHRR